MNVSARPSGGDLHASPPDGHEHYSLAAPRVPKDFAELVAPPWWRTRWFVIACLSTSIALMWWWSR